MTGAEFRELLAAAGLTVRAAAELLKINESTIQRWRAWPDDDERSPIRYWAVRRIRQHTAERRGAVDDLSLLAEFSPTARESLFSGMVAAYSDIHAPLDQLSVENWQLGEALTSELERLVNSDTAERQEGDQR